MIKALLKAPSHKEVGFLLVGVDVLGDPLRQKMNRRKQRDNPDRFFENLSGFILFCSINWNLLNQIVNRYILAVLHQFVITILVNGIKKTIQAITIA